MTSRESIARKPKGTSAGVCPRCVSTILLLVFTTYADAEEPTHYPEQMNHLSQEKSPYLLQHKDNPVHWFAWGPKAFEVAQKRDVPIILSIGYSTCHWCHVMEEESFENEEIARVMNENFVSIKVDREERPDVDSIYMNYVMATTGAGGWPMTVFLTPDRKPFYGGTYFPPDDRYGRPGFKSLLLYMSGEWKNNRDKIIQSGDQVVKALNAKAAQTEGVSLDPGILENAYLELSSGFDSVHGGFGSAPKFPRSHALSFLLRYYTRHQDSKALEMVNKSLHEMARGGMYDQLGGGFHRYSVDASWRVPHFEKMLYDQALLSKTYLEAFQVTANPAYERVAREILDYVLRDMTGKEGGFFSAEDADSPDWEKGTESSGKTPRREGAFYVWRAEDIRKILSPEEAGIIIHHYGVKANGNVIQDPHGEFENQNILYEASSLGDTAKHFKKTAEATDEILNQARERLYKERSSRPRPHLDDKVLTDWNGLMISSLAYASRVLNEPRYLDGSLRAANFVRSRLRDAEGNLLHRYREGDAGIRGGLEDYAFLILGYLDLYEASFEVKWLMEASKLADAMKRLFWDDVNGGFFMTARDAGKFLITRPKEFYDGAIPSGNSVAALVLMRLSRITMNRGLEEDMNKIFSAGSHQINHMPSQFTQLLMAYDFAAGPSREIVIAGSGEETEFKTMIRKIYSRFIPNKIVLAHLEDSGSHLEAIAPFVKEQVAINGKPAAYVCENYICRLPVQDPEKLDL